MHLFDSDVKVDRSLHFAMNLPRSEVICLQSKVICITLDALHFRILPQLLKQGTTPALPKCTMLHSPIEQIEQESRKWPAYDMNMQPKGWTSKGQS